MASHDGETHAQAMTLLGQGVSSERIAAITGVPARTIRDWSRSPELATKYKDAIEAGRERLAFRTTQLADRIVDAIEDGTVDQLPVSPVQGFTLYGIASDKYLNAQKQQTNVPQSLVDQLLSDRADHIRLQVTTVYDVQRTSHETPPVNDATIDGMPLTDTV